MQPFDVVAPTTVDEAVRRLACDGAVALAGGTDLLPNVKHELVSPREVVALGGLAELHGIEVRADGALSIGALVTLDELARDARVVSRAPALAQAAGLVAGPQLRRMGTLGGNVLLDTRCQWFNQSHFWRSALGFCLKKDGTTCHVIASGSKCVAAASNDTAAPLLTLDARLQLASVNGRREIPISELYRADGIHNLTLERGELLVRVVVPQTAHAHRGAYGKLRERGSIDFPLFGIAVRLDLDERRATIMFAALAAVALQARPLLLPKAAAVLVGASIGGSSFDEALGEAVKIAHRQLHPVDNVPGDSQWRRAMVPIYVRETLRAAANGTGPVHGR